MFVISSLPSSPAGAEESPQGLSDILLQHQEGTGSFPQRFPARIYHSHPSANPGQVRGGPGWDLGIVTGPGRSGWGCPELQLPQSSSKDRNSVRTPWKRLLCSLSPAQNPPGPGGSCNPSWRRQQRGINPGIQTIPGNLHADK